MIRARTVIVLAILGATTFFVLGWLAQSLVSNKTPTSMTSESASDAGSTEPVLMFDASIDLLDGKKLRLDLPDKPIANPP